eukprot:scaffold2939_cov123-Cylindrotheca_fusiformis.AAC.12
MSKIRGILIDLSGTVHLGDKAIPGAIESLERLRNAGKRIRFVTNTSTKSSATLSAELRTMGILPSKDDKSDGDNESLLVTSVVATSKYLVQNQLKPFCLLEDTSDFSGVDLAPPHNCVVIGLAPSKLNYDNLNKAFRILLKDANKKNLIAIHRGNYYSKKDDELSLGPGGFVTALESTANCQATVIGKPSKEFFHSALWDDIGLNETCMIGDDSVGDIQGAIDAGIGTGILVRTGKYRSGDEQKCGNANAVTCDSIVQAVDYILARDESEE